LGLYDLWAETADAQIGKLFTDGLSGLEHMIEFWNYRDKWTWYGSHAYLCPPKYHELNRALLSVVSELSSNDVLKGYATSWDPRQLTRAQRLEVFLVFLLTKNASRLRHLTIWQKRNA